MNTNTYSGASDTGELDKLFRFNDETGKFEDILTKDYNIGVLENLAGRSVACIDRKGNGLGIPNRKTRWLWNLSRIPLLSVSMKVKIIGKAGCFCERNIGKNLQLSDSLTKFRSKMKQVAI